MINPVTRSALHEQLEKHEGKRYHPYLDCCGKPWRECACRKKGKLTIGIGRNLDDVGLRDSEIALMLDNDIDACDVSLTKALPWYERLDSVRVRVLVDMCFNMGISGLLTFQNTLADMAAGRNESAASRMLASLWATQVKARAQRLARMWRTGEQPTWR